MVTRTARPSITEPIGARETQAESPYRAPFPRTATVKPRGDTPALSNLSAHICALLIRKGAV
jgi:hypothetical protein